MWNKTARGLAAFPYRAHAPGPLPFVWILLILLVPVLLPFAPGASAQEPLRGKWVRFGLTGRALEPEWGASSVLESDQPLAPSRYGPEKALDGDPATSWVEGAPGPGIGESYVVAFSHYPEALGFHNGYAKNGDLFAKNHRLKDLRITVFAGLMVSGFATERTEFFDAVPISEVKSVRLSDTMEAQRVPLPFDRSAIRSGMEELKSSAAVSSWRFPQAEEMGLDGSEGVPRDFRYIVRLEIADVYRGSKWEDTCMAELWPDYGTAHGVSVSGDQRSLVITGKGGERIRTYADFEYVLTVAETSENDQWAIVIKEPAYADSGSVSSEYAVIHTPTGRDVSREIFGASADLGLGLLPTGFSAEDSAVYIEYEDLESGEKGRAPCTLY